MLSYIHTLYSACLLSPKEGRKEEYAELHRLQNFTHVARCATIGEIRSRMRHSPQNKLVIPWIIDNHDRTLRIRLVHLPTATIARKQNCHRLDDIQQRKNKRKKKKNNGVLRKSFSILRHCRDHARCVQCHRFDRNDHESEHARNFLYNTYAITRRSMHTYKWKKRKKKTRYNWEKKILHIQYPRIIKIEIVLWYHLSSRIIKNVFLMN